MTRKGERIFKAAWPVYRRQIERLFGQYLIETDLDFLMTKLSALNQTLKEVK
jgi:hypothetical protein